MTSGDGSNLLDASTPSKVFASVLFRSSSTLRNRTMDLCSRRFHSRSRRRGRTISMLSCKIRRQSSWTRRSRCSPLASLRTNGGHSIVKWQTCKIRFSPFERPINDSTSNVIRIRSRRARPVCIQESENFRRKVARGVKEEREENEEKAKFFATANSGERADATWSR